jgi:hypothetical protein
MVQRQESFEGGGKRQGTGSGQNASTLLWQRGHFEKCARCCVALCGGEAEEGRRRTAAAAAHHAGGRALCLMRGGTGPTGCPSPSSLPKMGSLYCLACGLGGLGPFSFRTVQHCNDCVLLTLCYPSKFSFKNTLFSNRNVFSIKTTGFDLTCDCRCTMLCDEGDMATVACVMRHMFAPLLCRPSHHDNSL